VKKALSYAGIVVGLILLAVLAYGAKGYWDATSDADRLRAEADELIDKGRGGDALGAEHLAMLLKVQDPSFETHSGVDFTTPGAGATTINQSLSQRLAFEKFQPGIGKIRQTGYALGLEQVLSKAQILALWLDTLEMGKGPDGWMTGFFTASTTIFGRPPAELDDAEFLRLIAVLIAPASYDLTQADAALDERVGRITRLVSGDCTPLDHDDVWLDGCST
jgi:monofunctional glycosyltransferase